MCQKAVWILNRIWFALVCEYDIESNGLYNRQIINLSRADKTQIEMLHNLQVLNNDHCSVDTL